MAMLGVSGEKTHSTQSDGYKKCDTNIQYDTISESFSSAGPISDVKYNIILLSSFVHGFGSRAVAYGFYGMALGA
jgi:hypothetical protein